MLVCKLVHGASVVVRVTPSMARQPTAILPVLARGAKRVEDHGQIRFSK